MLSSSVAGGSVCLRCQLRAATCRAVPILTASQSQVRSRSRRPYASEATKSENDDLVAILSQHKHREPSFQKHSNQRKHRHRQAPVFKDDWDDPAPPKPQVQAQKEIDATLDEGPQKAPTEEDSPPAPTHDGKESGEFVRRIEAKSPAEKQEEYLDLVKRQKSELERLRREAEAKAMEWENEKDKTKQKWYVRGDTKLVTFLPKLDQDTLGQETEVVVLREQGRIKRHGLKQDETPFETTPIFDEQDVSQEQGLSVDAIMDNIDELRPDDRVLPARQYKAIFDNLLSGFTAVQLEAYVERHHKRIVEGDESPYLGVMPDIVRTYPWIAKQSSWTPEVEGAVPYLDYPLKGYILTNMSPKQRLCMQLIRECWGISAQELMDGNGVLEVQVNDLEFQLLTLGHQRWMKSITRAFLSKGQGDRIEVVKSRNLLRIKAPKAVAEACLQGFDRPMQKIRSKKFKLDADVIERVESDVFEQLGHLTSSLITLHRRSREVEVTWIHIRDESEAELEDTAHMVHRLLVTAYKPTDTVRAMMVYPDVMNKGILIENYTSEDKLPWTDRRKNWARLHLPLSSKVPTLSKFWPLTDEPLKFQIQPYGEDVEQIRPDKTSKIRHFWNSKVGVPLAFPRPPREPPREEQKPPMRRNKYELPTPSNWLPFKNKTTAVFGHILHQSLPGVPEIRNLAESYRPLSPMAPPIGRIKLGGFTPYLVPKTLKSILLLRFAPYPEDPSTKNPFSPRLELRIRSSKEGVTDIQSLRAFSHTHTCDILLPTEQVDFRITQRLIAFLPGNLLQNTDGMQHLIEFIHKSKLDVDQGRIITPPYVSSIGLPKWLFYDYEKDIDSRFLSKTGKSKILKARAAKENTIIAADGTVATSSPSDASKQGTDSSSGGSSSSDSGSSDEDDPVLETHCYEPKLNTLTHLRYIFTGMEIHRSEENAYDGWRIKYTSIEAGQGGAHRSELSLEGYPGMGTSIRYPQEKLTSQKFLTSAYKVARGLTGSKFTRDHDGKECVSTIGWSTQQY